MKPSKYDKRQTHGEDYYKKIGKLGGSAKVKKGFGKNPKLASIAGKKGGSATPYASLSFSAADEIQRVLLKNENLATTAVSRKLATRRPYQVE